MVRVYSAVSPTSICVSTATSPSCSALPPVAPASPRRPVLQSPSPRQEQGERYENESGCGAFFCGKQLAALFVGVQNRDQAAALPLPSFDTRGSQRPPQIDYL